MALKETEGVCIVCKGDLVEKIVKKYNPRTGPPIMGPGSKKQYNGVSHGFHCKVCGLKYEHIPTITT